MSLDHATSPLPQNPLSHSETHFTGSTVGNMDIPKHILLLTFHPLSIFFHFSCEIPKTMVDPVSTSPQQVLGSWRLLLVQFPLIGMLSHNNLTELHPLLGDSKGNCKSQRQCVRKNFYQRRDVYREGICWILGVGVLGAGSGVCCSGVSSQGWGLDSECPAAVMGLWHRHRAAGGKRDLVRVICSIPLSL